MKKGLQKSHATVPLSRKKYNINFKFFFYSLKFEKRLMESRASFFEKFPRNRHVSLINLKMWAIKRIHTYIVVKNSE